MLADPFRLPDPALRSARLLLRPWEPDDAADLVAAWHDPDIACWTGVPPNRDPAVALRWIERTAVLRDEGRSLDLVIDAEGAVAGEVGLVRSDTGDLEVGWWMAPGHRGRGLATEAVRCFLAWLHDPHGGAAGAVLAACAEANPASGAVAGGAGFQPTDLPAGPGIVIWRSEPTPRAGTLHP